MTRRAVAGNPVQVQMDGLARGRRLEQWEAPWLVGYEASKPVRFGNAPSKQLQLDISVWSGMCSASRVPKVA